MAYRTYRNLYRIRPSLSSIGQGRQRIRLPRGVSITLDVAILTVVLWIPSTFTLGVVISNFLPIPSGLVGFAMAGWIAFQLGKLDPAGKTIIAFLYDWVKYMIRSKNHDGFEVRPHVSVKSEKVEWSAKVALVEDGQVGSLPAKGRVKQLELKVPAAVKVKRGEVIIQHRGQRLAPGLYEVSSNGLRAKRLPPKIGRNRMSL